MKQLASITLLLFCAIANIGYAQQTLATSDAVTHKSEDRWQQFYDDPTLVYGNQVRYQVSRNDKVIGEHTVVFQKSQDTLLVTVKSELAVRYLGVVVYRYMYQVVETWVDGELNNLAVEIKDNRKPLREIFVQSTDRVLKVTDAGKSRLAPKIDFATTYWHPGGIEVPRVFHTTHGKVKNMNVQDLGQAKLSLPTTDNSAGYRDRVVDAQHYQIGGGFQADLWYDKQGRWLALQFKADDGSRIDYKCLSCSF